MFVRVGICTPQLRANASPFHSRCSGCFVDASTIANKVSGRPCIWLYHRSVYSATAQTLSLPAVKTGLHSLYLRRSKPLFWSHKRESNPRYQFGRLAYYRCTTAAYLPGVACPRYSVFPPSSPCTLERYRLIPANPACRCGETVFFSCPWPDSNRRHPPLAMVRTFFPTELQGRIYPVFPGMCEFQKDLLAILFAQKRKPQIQTFKRRRIIHLSFYSNLFLSAQTWPLVQESNPDTNHPSVIAAQPALF